MEISTDFVNGVIFTLQSYRIMFVTSGYFIVCFGAMGAILGVWN